MKRNLSSYFFKKSWAHYSFGKMLLSGVLALAITASTVGGSAAAAIAMQSASSSSAPSTVATPTVAPTPTPTPTPVIHTEFLEMEWYASLVGAPATPVPDIEVTLNTGGSQQKLSVGVYTEKKDENGYTWNEIIIGVPMELTIVCEKLTKLEHEEHATGHAASVKGAISKYDINTKTGTFQLGEIDPGEYLVSVSCDVEHYAMPEPVMVKVEEKINYEVDEDVEMEDEDAGFEDEGELDDTVVEDTVRFVESSTTTQKYNAFWLSADHYWTNGTAKYFYYIDGTKSPYKITTATQTIDGKSYEYYTQATLDTSLSWDAAGVVIEKASATATPTTSASTVSATKANTASVSTIAALDNTSMVKTATTATEQAAMQDSTVNFSGLTPLSLSVNKGKSEVSAFGNGANGGVKTLSTVTTKTLVVSSDTTNYMTITDTVEPTVSPTVTEAPSATVEPTPTPTEKPTPTPTASPSPTVEPTPTASPSPTVAPTPTPSASPSPSVAPTPTPTASPSPSPSPSPTPTASPSASVSPSPTPTVSPSPSPTASPAKLQSSVVLYSNGSAKDSAVTKPDGTSTVASKYFKLKASDVVQNIYSGWQTIGGAKYYYDPDTNKPVTGTQVINGTTYIFGATGAYDSKCTGIDVSYWQGSIDWNKVKAAGVEFVIIRAGYRGYSSGTIVQDKNFNSYISGAKAAGLRVGIYFFSQAINAKEGVEEASACINLIKAYGTSYPIYIDTELSGSAGNVGRADHISNADRTAAVVAFCETIRSAGYTPGIYASYSWFTTKLNFSEISGYSLWNAQWGTYNSLAAAGMWQYTNSGAVNGISGRVDMNISYIG